MKQKRFDSMQGYIPSMEDIKQQNERHNLYDLYGIPYGVFGGEKISYTKDEADAIQCIGCNKELPADLAERLIKSKQARNAERRMSCGKGQTVVLSKKKKKFLQSMSIKC